MRSIHAQEESNPALLALRASHLDEGAQVLGDLARMGRYEVASWAYDVRRSLDHAISESTGGLVASGQALERPAAPDKQSRLFVDLPDGESRFAVADWVSAGLAIGGIAASGALEFGVEGARRVTQILAVTNGGASAMQFSMAIFNPNMTARERRHCVVDASFNALVAVYGGMQTQRRGSPDAHPVSTAKNAPKRQTSLVSAARSGVVGQLRPAVADALFIKHYYESPAQPAHGNAYAARQLQWEAQKLRESAHAGSFAKDLMARLTNQPERTRRAQLEDARMIEALTADTWRAPDGSLAAAAFPQQQAELNELRELFYRTHFTLDPQTHDVKSEAAKAARSWVERACALADALVEKFGEGVRMNLPPPS